MQNILLVDADNNPIINGKERSMQTKTSIAVNSQKNIGSLPKSYLSKFDILSTFFVYIALFFAAYWFFIRPQKKHQEKLADFQSNLKPGDDIITTAGLHGKIIEVNEKTFLIEFGVNKTIRIPINKNHIIAAEEEQEKNE